jgi:hypothetical protein
MADNLPVPKWFDARKILELVVEGKRTEDIAAQLGTSKERLSFYLRKHSPEDWKEAQIIRELRRKDEAEDDIDNANDAIQLNKAIAKLKSAQWSLERVYRRVYGDVKEPEDRRPVFINIDIRRPATERVIEQE